MMPGVHAVLTHDDVPGEKTYGIEFREQPVLAIDRVRYFGGPVALVAAEHPEQARRAAERIRVDFELLAPIVDAEHATEEEPIHPGRPTAGHGYRDDARPNVVRSVVIRHGDPDAQGAVTVSGVYEVGIQDQAFLGPESGLAVPDGEGGVDVYVATQWLHHDRDQVAPCLGLKPEQVRIQLAGVGGAFGGRQDLSMQIHGAMLALHTNRSRPPPSGEDLGGAPGHARGEARLRPSADLARRRSVRLHLCRGDVERRRVRVRSVCGRQRADRKHVRFHQQPTLRSDAGLRRRAGVLRARGTDGKARGGARDRSDRAPAPQLACTRRRDSHRAAHHRLVAGCRSHPPRRGAPGAQTGADP
jgi:Molybdopterin-binding domain of aldehyde dehydrogenase/Aldehyde oxidase and xanthine dehydrogenase, a/b hammerhead domain